MLLSFENLTGMGPGLEEIKVGGGKLPVGRRISLVDLTAAGLLRGQALGGWQREDLTSAWPSSAAAFIRGGEGEGKIVL